MQKLKLGREFKKHGLMGEAIIEKKARVGL